MTQENKVAEIPQDVKDKIEAEAKFRTEQGYAYPPTFAATHAKWFRRGGELGYSLRDEEVAAKDKEIAELTRLLDLDNEGWKKYQAWQNSKEGKENNPTVLKQEIAEQKKSNKLLHEAMVTAEQRGFDKAREDAASKQVGVGNVWQLCPKCQGQGQVSKPPGMPVEVQEWASTEISFMCDVCNGTKIIAPPVQQVGNVWVKASERLPVKGKPVPLKFWGLYGSGRSVGYYIVDDHNGTLKNEEVEWLDESGSLAEENRRLREALEKSKTFLFKHQEWEAMVISEDTFWWPKSDKDALRGKIYEDFCELQVERNKCFEAINALASVSDGKQKEEGK